MRWWPLLLLTGCLSPDPYPDYFENPDAAPHIDGLQYTPQTGSLGGQELVITGKRLAGTTTVVIGSRNAEILDVQDGAVTVVVPDQPSFARNENVTVVTKKGFTRMEGGFAYQPHDGDFARNETASAAFTRIDCPIVGYGKYQQQRYPLWWCGVESGWQEGVAWDGVSGQSGLAWDLSEYAPVASAPGVTHVRVWGPNDRRPPLTGLVADYHSIGDAFIVESDRDFERDLAFIEQRAYRLAHQYYWLDDVTDLYPVARFYGDGVCFPTSVPISGARGDALQFDGPVPEDATGLWLGLRLEESDGGTGVIESDGWTGTAYGVPDGSDFIGDPSGIELLYDDFSGYYWATGPGGLVGQSDMPWWVPQHVYERHLGKEIYLGQVTAARPLRVWDPVFVRGDVRIRLDRDFDMRWEPNDSDLPSIVVFDLRVYDSDIEDPNWMTEIGRLVATGNDRTGRLHIPRDKLAQLPNAPNRLTFDDDFTGHWADLTVARHQLRKVPLPDGQGDLVINFSHVVNTPVELGRWE